MITLKIIIWFMGFGAIFLLSTSIAEHFYERWFFSKSKQEQKEILEKWNTRESKFYGLEKNTIDWHDGCLLRQK